MQLQLGWKAGTEQYPPVPISLPSSSNTDATCCRDCAKINSKNLFDFDLGHALGAEGLFRVFTRRCGKISTKSWLIHT